MLLADRMVEAEVFMGEQRPEDVDDMVAVEVVIEDDTGDEDTEDELEKVSSLDSFAGWNKYYKTLFAVFFGVVNFGRILKHDLIHGTCLHQSKQIA